MRLLLCITVEAVRTRVRIAAARAARAQSGRGLEAGCERASCSAAQTRSFESVCDDVCRGGETLWPAKPRATKLAARRSLGLASAGAPASGTREPLDL